MILHNSSIVKAEGFVGVSKIDSIQHCIVNRNHSRNFRLNVWDSVTVSTLVAGKKAMACTYCIWHLHHGVNISLDVIITGMQADDVINNPIHLVKKQTHNKTVKNASGHICIQGRYQYILLSLLLHKPKITKQTITNENSMEITDERCIPLNSPTDISRIQ